jgi:hypothetical protein
MTGELRQTFKRQGYVVVPGFLTGAQIAAGRRIVADQLTEPPPTGPHFLWPRFGAGGHPLLDFYREVGLADLAAGFLRPGLGPEEPDFAQIALTTPPYPHIPGSPHVDGITPCEADGRPGTFSMLAGVWLTDQSETDRGNLWVWPGTHLRTGEYLAEHGPDALSRVAEMRPGPYPKVDLGTPVQAVGPAGSVLFAHYLLGHNIGGHFGPAGDERRETIYFRLRAIGHRERWREVVTDPLVELH